MYKTLSPEERLCLLGVLTVCNDKVPSYASSLDFVPETRTKIDQVLGCITNTNVVAAFKELVSSFPEEFTLTE